MENENEKTEEIEKTTNELIAERKAQERHFKKNKYAKQIKEIINEYDKNFESIQKHISEISIQFLEKEYLHKHTNKIFDIGTEIYKALWDNLVDDLNKLKNTDGLQIMRNIHNSIK
jgi:F0F1-type ATP synthase membrane subunit b/b'